MDKGIGKLGGTEPGSAARFNVGKPDLSLIPLEIIAELERVRANINLGLKAEENLPVSVYDAMGALGAIQMREPQPESWAIMVIADFCGWDWEGCARVFEYGKHKYDEWNWLKGMSWSAVIASCARHMFAIMRGHEFDEESGLHHKAHIMCNLVMLKDFETNYPAGDDRPQRIKKM